MNVIKTLKRNKVFVINIIALIYFILSLFYPYRKSVEIVDSYHNIVLILICLLNIIKYKYLHFNFIHLFYFYVMIMYLRINFSDGLVAEFFYFSLKLYNKLLIISILTPIFRYLFFRKLLKKELKKYKRFSAEIKLNISYSFLFVFITIFIIQSGFIYREIVIIKNKIINNKEVKHIEIGETKDKVFDLLGSPDSVYIFSDKGFYDEKLDKFIKNRWKYKNSFFKKDSIYISFNKKNEVVNIEKRPNNSFTYYLKDLFF